jgi:hypothetical protein
VALFAALVINGWLAANLMSDRALVGADRTRAIRHVCDSAAPRPQRQVRTTSQGLRDRLVPELVRTGRAHEEVERSRPETVALSDRLQPAYQKVLERNPGGGVGSGRWCS